eukprot:Rmarinus@m.12963
MCGIASNVVVETLGLRALFDVSTIILLTSTLLIALTWEENYGETGGTATLVSVFYDGLSTFFLDTRVFKVCVIQTLFEGAMYTFVLLWTPALESRAPAEDVPLGVIFACFMLSMMTGSLFFLTIIGDNAFHPRTCAMCARVFICGAFIFIGLGFSSDYHVSLLLLVAFEFCVGFYWPTMSSLRGRFVPERVRATIMNLCRLPLNTVVVFLYLNPFQMTVETTFYTCAVLLFTAAGLLVTLPPAVESEVKENQDQPRRAKCDGVFYSPKS